MFKKFFWSVAVWGVFVVPLCALAYDYGAGDTARELGYKTDQNIYGIISLVTGVMLSLTAIVFFGFMLYAGIRWMTARGNEDLAEKAKHTLTAAAMGFVIIVLSYALTRFAFNRLNDRVTVPVETEIDRTPSQTPPDEAGPAEHACYLARSNCYASCFKQAPKRPEKENLKCEAVCEADFRDCVSEASGS